MIGTSPLCSIQHLLSPPPPDDPNPEFDFRAKEQDCLYFLKSCRNIEEFKQSHAQILKWGFFWNPFCAGNLVATCGLSNWGSMEYACSIFREIDDPGTFIFNTMIRGYVKDLNFVDALQVYDEMLERGVQPDDFTYPVLLKACALLERLDKGIQIHGQIIKFGFGNDLLVQNSLINMYGKCREIELAYAVFEQIEAKSAASWSSIISVHASLGLFNECLMLAREMSRDGCCRPGESVMVNVLSSCAHLGDLRLGKCSHGFLLRNINELNVAVLTSLVDMYVKCGCLEKGLYLFRKMPERNRLSYSVMISGLAIHGRGEDALKIFSEMIEEGLEPDDVVYVSLLSSCSHANLIDEGFRLFHRMKTEHKIEPTMQHYGCMVDLMGRAGMISEALEFIENMPIKPNDVIWRSLLNACKLHSNLEMGETAAKHLFHLNSQNPSDYLVLSNMYAIAHRWDDVAKTRTEMARRGLSQTPGTSLVEVRRKVFKFVSQDMSKPQCKDIYAMIRQMEWQLRFEGYTPDTSQVWMDVDEAEKIERLKGHSQKLAIAFALMNTSKGETIRIARNLRMCSDCHNYTKLISSIYGIEIVVKDRNRFHHFKGGSCSCRDYW